MADDVTFQSSTLATPPAGTIVSADQETGTNALVQRVKLTYSADGSAAHVTADANGLEVQGAGTAGTPAGGVVSVQGVASGTALPVSAASLPLPSGAATLAEQQSQTTALQLLDDTVYTDGTGTPSKAIGVAGTDGTNPQILKTDAAGELQVDVLTLPNVTIGAAIPAGTNNIGDVDVLTVPAPLSTTGGGTEATALRVTLASDSTGVVSVDDNGGSLTVDGTVAVTNAGTFPVQVDGAALTALQLIDDVVKVEDDPHVTGDKGVMALAVRKDTGAALAGLDADYSPLQVDASGNLRVNVAAGGAGDGAILDGVSSSIKATVLDYTNSNPLAVRLTDTSGDYVGAGAGTQYTEDAVAAADPVGTQIVSRRRDTLSATEVSLDGDVIAVNATNKGELYVKHADAIPVTDNSGSLTVDNAALSVTGGGVEASALRVTLASDSTGVVSVDDNGGSLTVDGTVTANLAAGTNNIGDVDVLSIAAGDNNIGNVDIVTVPAPLSTTGGGTEATALRVTVASDSTGVLSVDDNGGSLTVDGTVTASNTAGDVASDAADSGNPVKIGALAKSGDITAVADADRVNLIATLLGKAITVPYATPAKTWNYAAAAGGLVNTTGVTVKAAAGAGIRNYITKVSVINSHQTTSTEVVIRDGAAGTVLWRGWAQAAGGGCADKFDPPLRGTANTLVEIAEVTTTATAGVLVNVSGFEAAE